MQPQAKEARSQQTLKRGKAGTSPRVFGESVALPAFELGLLAPELAESKFLSH